MNPEQLDCARCDATDLSGYSQTLDKDDNVLETICLLCHDKEWIAKYEKSGRISTSLSTMAYLTVHGLPRKGLAPEKIHTLHLVFESMKEVYDKIREFNQDVWFAGLQKFIQGEDTHGHSATFTDEMGHEIKFLSLAMCGRWRATIQDPEGSFIDIITVEDESEARMGLNGIGSTTEAALRLLESAITAWKAGEIKLIPNGDVHILGSRGVG